MTVKLRHFTPLLAAGAAAAAIAAAPIASAANPHTCSDTGGATTCQKSGHARVNAPAPPALPNLGPLSMYGPFFWQNPH